MKTEDVVEVPIGGYVTTFKTEVVNNLKASEQYVVDRITDSGKFILRRVR